MPKGRPPADLLTSRRVRAFSIDTSVIEAASFAFDRGGFRLLSSQLPPWMELWVSTVVHREVQSHRMAHVERGLDDIRAGIESLKRHIGESFQEGNTLWLQGVPHSAREVFSSQFDKFLLMHQGRVVGFDDVSQLRELFDRYFQGRPPFGGGKDKKHEFPDAAALLSLEWTAQKSNCHLIAVSKDKGWQAFADESDLLYCVASLEELASLFVTNSDQARRLQRALSAALENPASLLSRAVIEHVRMGVTTMPWRVLPFQCWSHDVELKILEVDLASASVMPDVAGVWMTPEDDKRAVVEVGVQIDAVLQLAAVASSGWYGDEKTSAVVNFDIDHSAEIRVALELRGRINDAELSTLIAGAEIRTEPIAVRVHQIDFGGDVGLLPRPTRGFSSGFDDDDLPF